MPLDKLGEREVPFICSGNTELKRSEKRTTLSKEQKNMAALSKEQKASIQEKRRRQQQITPRKNLAKQRKLPFKSRRNICLIKLPKSCNLQSCPLMSWCFNKRMQDNILSFRMASPPLGSFWAGVYRRMTMQAGGQKNQGCNHAFPDILKTTMKAMDKRHAKQKGTPAAKTAKPRRRYSDEEIFYRLAKPSTLNDAEDSSSRNDVETLDAAGVPDIPQSLAGTPQPVAS